MMLSVYTGNPFVDLLIDIGALLIALHGVLFFWYIVLLGEDIKLHLLLVRLIHDFRGHQRYVENIGAIRRYRCACGWHKNIKKRNQ